MSQLLLLLPSRKRAEQMALPVSIGIWLYALYRLMSAWLLRQYRQQRWLRQRSSDPPLVVNLKCDIAEVGQIDESGRLCATSDCYLVKGRKIEIRPGDIFLADPRLRTLENFTIKEKKTKEVDKWWANTITTPLRRLHIDGLYCESRTVGRWMDIIAKGENCNYDLETLEPIDLAMSGGKVKSTDGVEVCATKTSAYAEVILTADQMANNNGRQCNALLALKPKSPPDVYYFVRYKDRFVEGALHKECALGKSVIVWRRSPARFERFKDFMVDGKRFSRDSYYLDDTEYEEDVVRPILKDTDKLSVGVHGYWSSSSAKKTSKVTFLGQCTLILKADGVLYPTAPENNVFKVVISAKRIYRLKSHSSLEPLAMAAS